jgi:hypothetical protein
MTRQRKRSWATSRKRGEAYPSEVEEDLELDYELVCQITEELKREGRLGLL